MEISISILEWSQNNWKTKIRQKINKIIVITIQFTYGVKMEVKDKWNKKEITKILIFMTGKKSHMFLILMMGPSKYTIMRTN